jgi:hypothetical protein
MNEVKRPSLREAARRGAEANRQTKQHAPAPKPKPTVAVAKPAEAVKPTATPATEKATEPRREKPRPRLARLPHGSTFHVVYDAEAVKWSGTLTVPQGGIYNGSVTTGEDSAVFALLMQLDRAYRRLPAEAGGM